MTRPRFNEPRFTVSGEERIRRAIERGHSGDDPKLPIRKASVRRDGRDFISWFGPVVIGCSEVELWAMEIDLDKFRSMEEIAAMRVAGA
jgi:hypothetical protein